MHLGRVGAVSSEGCTTISSRRRRDLLLRGVCARLDRHGVRRPTASSREASPPGRGLHGSHRLCRGGAYLEARDRRGRPLLRLQEGGPRFTIEQTEDEVSITRGDRITYEEIIEAFGGEKEKEIYEETVTRKRRYRINHLLPRRFDLALFLSSTAAPPARRCRRHDREDRLETNAPVRENTIKLFQPGALRPLRS